MRQGLVALLLFAFPPSALPQIQSKQEELGRVHKELETTRREIEAYRRQEQTLSRELEKIEGRNVEAKRKIRELQGHLRLAESRKAELGARLGALARASEFWRAALQADARRYVAAQASRYEAFGREGLWEEAFRREALREKAELLAGLQGVSRRTESAVAETRRRAQEILDSSRKAQEEQQSRRHEYEEKKSEMAQAGEKAAAAARRAKELEESARALTRLIRSLGKARPYERPGGGALELPRHSLPWPAKGSLLKAFGRQKNPELGTWVIHQGILLQTQPRAPVAAVEAGRVIFAGPFRSYGEVVILDHGSNFFSIYGELGRVLKSKGAEVQAGETIAEASGLPAPGVAGAGVPPPPSTGSGLAAPGVLGAGVPPPPSTGSGLAAPGVLGAGVPPPAETGRGRLYLELRRGTEALDPLQWLRKR